MKFLDWKTMDQPRRLLWLSVLSLLCFLLWAAVADVDQVTRASGQVIPSSRSQIIQAPEAGGVLSTLPVREGESVEKGQLIAVLDATRAESSYLEAKAKASSLQGQLARLEAETYDRPLVFPETLKKEHPEVVEVQGVLYAKRRQAIQGDLNALGKSLALARKELALNQPLLASGDIARADIIRLQRQEADLEMQQTSRRNKYFQDAQTELAKVQEDLATVQQTLNQRKDALDHTEIRAPMTGYVKNIRITTLGAVLKPGEEIMQIVPKDDDLLFEVKVRPQDVAHLKPGIPAIIKVDAYDYTIYGTLSGTLTYLSPDTLNEDIKPNELPYYRAQIKSTGRRFSGRPDEKLEIQPGMTTTVELITGSNTVLKFLLKPVIKTVSGAFHEK